ncbi:hypothetical protein CYMTET_40878 [Cymbomonas tetramitiformis]|uniref:Uncharacterized protein n=1 Tax=Cymbomonas tetramitiformis TaxID=36881 RepID=A0AAE0F462_9CHLO|nr:hypothetical protein CYMTET_40878 [Cymbomonas tetramitiformis]
MVQPLYATIKATRFATGDENVVSRPGVPADHVHRLIEKINKVNRIDKTKVNCKPIVDPFAGSSGILEHANTFLKESLVGDLADAFKEFEFVSVDHPDIKKVVKLNMRGWTHMRGTPIVQLPLRIAYARHQSQVWMVVVNSKYRGQNLFSKSTNVERAGSGKEVHLHAKYVEQAIANANA